MQMCWLCLLPSVFHQHCLIEGQMEDNLVLLMEGKLTARTGGGDGSPLLSSLTHDSAGTFTS